MIAIPLSEAEIRLLNYERFRNPSVLIQKRLHAVYLKLHSDLNLTSKAVGLCCDLCANSVNKWVKVYQNEGLEALLTVNYVKNVSTLETFKEVILESFNEKAPLSIKEAVSRIEKQTGLQKSETSVRKWMKRKGFKFRRLGHIPAKANLEAQQEWVEKAFEPHHQRAKAGQCHLFFMDAAHFVLHPYLCAVWCLARLFIKAPAGRQRLNVVGAVHAITKQVVIHSNITYVNAEVIAEFFKTLAGQYSDLPIVIVLDNARYQHCKFITQLAEQLQITLLFLPPYSPNLNIIERLWKMVKKQCLYGQYYEKFEGFQKAILGCFENLNQKDLDQVLNVKFQFFPKSQIYPA
jgi:transposase